MFSSLETQFSQHLRLLERLTVRMENAGEGRLEKACRELERTATPLTQLGKMAGLRQEHELARLELKLQSLDPYAPLKRGYAMAMNEDGSFLRSVKQTAPGKNVLVQLADGRLAAVVKAVENNAEGDEA